MVSQNELWTTASFSQNKYPIVNITKVIDGDTFKCIIDHGWDTLSKITIRLDVVNTPEDNAGLKAKQFTQDWLNKHTNIYVTNSIKVKDPFGRYLCTVIGTDQNGKVECLNDDLLSQNLAVKWEKKR